MIEEMISEKEPSYINAIIHLCDKNNIKVEDCKKYITEPIRTKLEQEASILNYLPKNTFQPLE